MAHSWFKYNCSCGNPYSPLCYTQILTIPTFITGSPTVAYIFATIQIINGIIRPVIPPFSTTGAVTIGEINTDIATNTSSANCYVC